MCSTGLFLVNSSLAWIVVKQKPDISGEYWMDNTLTHFDFYHFLKWIRPQIKSTSKIRMHFEYTRMRHTLQPLWAYERNVPAAHTQSIRCNLYICVPFFFWLFFLLILSFSFISCCSQSFVRSSFFFLFIYFLVVILVHLFVIFFF